MYHIGIIGAGPAGATLARLLADRFRVLLIDNGREKCCGGILTPKSKRILAELDLTLPKSVLVNPQPFRVTILDVDNELIRHFSRQYINIDRSAFDRWLMSLIPNSVDFRREAQYRSAEKTADGYTVHFTQNGEERSETVRYLVGADGAFSTVRRQFFADIPQPKRYIAVQHWYEIDDMDFTNTSVSFINDYTGIFSSDITDFYAWTIPKNQHLILGAALPLNTPIAGKMNRLQQHLERYGLRFGTPQRSEAAQIVRPQRYSSICLGNDSVILLGEAAGLISPSSAEGISPALTSAYHLAAAFGQDGGYSVCRYRRSMRKLRLLLYLKNLKCPAMFHPFIRKLVLLSKVTVIRET